MRRAIFLAMLLAPAVSFAATPDKPPEKLIARIDSVVAKNHDGNLSIHVTGAVAGGGWKNVRLRPMRPHPVPGVYSAELVGTPPPEGSPVIEGLLPVSADLTVKVIHKMASIKVSSDGNEITSQILN